MNGKLPSRIEYQIEQAVRFVLGRRYQAKVICKLYFQKLQRNGIQPKTGIINPLITVMEAVHTFYGNAKKAMNGRQKFFHVQSTAKVAHFVMDIDYTIKIPSPLNLQSYQENGIRQKIPG